MALALALSVAFQASLARAQDLESPPPSVSAPTGPVPGAVIGPVRELAASLGPSRLQDGHWRGGILFDEGFRAALRLEAVDDQEIARHVSDVLLFTTVIGAAADALATPLAQGREDLALRASFAHLLALGVTMSAGELVKRAVGRARPFERDCLEDPTRTGCDDGDIFASFYSLHSGVTFTSAGFMCSMHGVRQLYGNVAADATACGLSVAMAATTGILRVVSDRHYLSDVLVGATMGFLVGFFLPLAMVPEVDHEQTVPVTREALEQAPVSAPIGLQLSGTF